MRSCVLVKISKQTLSFWYQIEGGVISPLSIKEGNEIPLCFYVSGNDFNIGTFARERSLLNDKCAYKDYFELVRDPSKYFNLHGDAKPIKQLLYYGIENYLSYFIKSVLFKSESIEAFRKTFCLALWFDDDISQSEKHLVESLFTEAGYENVFEANIDSLINEVLSDNSNFDRPRLVLSSISNDLYVKLFRYSKAEMLDQMVLENSGSDPRIKILATLILEDIREASPHIHCDFEKDIPYILDHCVALLANLRPIMQNSITLSSGENAEYKIRQAHLDDRLMFNRGVEDKLLPKLIEFLANNSLDPTKVDFILLGDELNTDYFKDKLSKKFPRINGVGSSLKQKVLKAFFKRISSTQYIGSDTKPPFPPAPPIPPPGAKTSIVPPPPPIPPPGAKTSIVPPPPPIPPPGAKTSIVPPPPPIPPPGPKTSGAPPPIPKPPVPPPNKSKK